MVHAQFGLAFRELPNTACTRLGVRAAFLSMFLAWADSRFEGESTLPPQAGNASRWAADEKICI
jgi:hypothetical protein